MAGKVEERLDQHYLFFISFVNTYYPFITNERDKKLCDQWMTKLCSEKVYGVSRKRNRNSFLAYFLMNLQEQKMTGPFSKPPEDGPLPDAKIIFGNADSPESIASADEAVQGDGFSTFSQYLSSSKTPFLVVFHFSFSSEFLFTFSM